MKRKLFCVFLGLEALLCAALSVSSVSFSAYFSAAAAFPFEQTAAALRALAQNGRLGSGAAWAMLALIGLALLLPMLRTAKWSERPLESILNVLLALCTVLAIRSMADTERLTGTHWHFIEEISPGIINAALGIAVWSLAAAWLVARLLRLFRQGDMRTLMGYAEKMLAALCVLFVGAAMLTCPGELAGALRERQSGADVLFALLSFAVNVLPYVLNTLISLSALRLLGGYRAVRQGEEAVAAAGRLSRLCCLSLLLVSLSTAGLDILQLAMLKWLSNVDVTLNIPVTSLAFTLAVLLLSRLIAENKRLADDNDLFI